MSQNTPTATTTSTLNRPGLTCARWVGFLTPRWAEIGDGTRRIHGVPVLDCPGRGATSTSPSAPSPVPADADTEERWLTPAKVGAPLQVGARTVNRWAREGRIPSVARLAGITGPEPRTLTGSLRGRGD